MIKKDDVVVGKQIQFNPILKKATAIAGLKFGDGDGKSVQVDYIPGYGQPGSFFNGASIAAQPNDVADIIGKLRRRDGINTIQLRIGEMEGYFYWIDIYRNGKII